MDNLRNSFPEKNEAELLRIEREFYKHFCDLILESIKAFSISEEEVSKRMIHKNTELFDQLAKQNRSVAAVGGHYCNWEWFGITIAQSIPHKALAFFTPLKSPFWNDKMTKSRSRFGLHMYSIKELKQLNSVVESGLTATMFGSDQSPSNPRKAYWTKFLNQDTGTQYGAEKHAIKFDTAVVFAEITKLKRGFYQTEYKLLYESVEGLEYGAVIELFTKNLEDQIKKKPEYYLWTHRRWKHKRPTDEKFEEEQKALREGRDQRLNPK
jgi:KDO2-lipid IV(A) lauroyltransferase